jgi:hypothetical protein
MEEFEIFGIAEAIEGSEKVTRTVKFSCPYLRTDSIFHGLVNDIA